ncbi:hypothetical protein [Spirosoma spitsbergense]|uniref:hypothetical protein n=1 Tax=Spirosoma spitsbergense TaxID=431554 RepID=UPI00047752A2|nr:hypothetical protein [Spirosoma spitsbergense]
MKSTVYSSFGVALVTLLMVFGCGGGKTTVAPVSERIAKVWSASKVDQNATTVYMKGGTANTVPGYSTFKLDLSSPTSARYTEVDGTTFIGTWSTPSDTRLVLSGLSPQPTGTNGTIEFTIGALTDTQLGLTRTTASQKTGGSINTYTLSNP